MKIYHAQRPARELAFTLLDLMVLVAMVMVLSALAMPALGTSRERALDAICLSNLGELARATHLFAACNDGWLPGNSEAGIAGIWARFPSAQNHANPTYLANSTNSQLAPYLKGNVRVFQCPADTRRDQPYNGGVFKLSRNYSLSCAVGTDSSKGGKAPVDGLWLDGGGHTANRTFYCYGRVSDMNHPSPSGLYWFVDEANNSINDGSFAVVGPGVAGRTLIDWPTERHNTGAGFVFGDGHGEIHLWSKPGISGDQAGNGVPIAPVAAAQDQAWLSGHATARIVP